MALSRVEGRGSRVKSISPALDCQLSTLASSSHGQALVETALALVLFLLALLGGMDFYLYEWDAWRMQEVAREAAAAAVDAPSEEAAKQWVALRTAEEVQAKGFSTTLDRVELSFPEGEGYGLGRRLRVELEARHRFLFLMRPLVESAPVKASAGGLVKPNRNWE